MTVPSFVSTTAGGNASATSLTALSAVDLSNCDLAIVEVFKGLVAGGEDLSLDASSSAGWVKVAQQRSGTSTSVTALFKKVAPTNNETLIVNGSSATASRMSAMVIRVSGANSLASASSATWDPPSLDIGAVEDNLWIATASYGNTTTFSSAGAPTGYTNFASVFDASSGTMAAATKGGTSTQVEDPGAWSASGIANTKTSWTIATWFAPAVIAVTASDLASSAPMIDSTTLTQENALSTSALETGAPAIDAATVSQAQSIAASALATVAAVIAGAALAQLHALSPTDIGTAGPQIEAAVLAQSHTIAPMDSATAAPAIDAAALSQMHAISASDLAGSSPEVSSGTLSQLHTIAPIDLATGATQIAAAGATINIAFDPTAIATSVPVVEANTLSQSHFLDAENISAAGAAIDFAAIAQEHLLSSGAFAGTGPAIAAAALSQQHSLAAGDLVTTASDIGSSTFTQIQAFATAGFETAPPQIAQGEFAQQHAFASAAVALPGPAIAASSILQTHVFESLDISTGMSPTVSQSTARRWIVADAARTTYSQPQNRLTISSQEGGPVPFKWPNKDPDEVLDYDHDHGPRLVGDEILTAESFVEAGDVTIESFDFLGSVQKTWLSGGSEGVKCRIGMRVTTRDGRTMDESAVLRIRSR